MWQPLHLPAGAELDIGRIDGAGRLYKSGLGQLTILNSSRLTGDVFIAGGNSGSYYSGQNIRGYDVVGRFFTIGVRFKM